MRTMFIAFLGIAVISIVAWYGLHQAGFSSAEKTSGGSVRLD